MRWPPRGAHLILKVRTPVMLAEVPILWSNRRQKPGFLLDISRLARVLRLRDGWDCKALFWRAESRCRWWLLHNIATARSMPNLHS